MSINALDLLSHIMPTPLISLSIMSEQRERATAVVKIRGCSAILFTVNCDTLHAKVLNFSSFKRRDSVAKILEHLNHSINGILYCITGSRFRHELKYLLSCWKTKRTAARNAMNTVTSQAHSHSPQFIQYN